MKTIFAVNEIFGPTFQGEGKNIGHPCIFLRLAGCSLACTWCDTPYAWDWSRYDPRVELHPMELRQVVTALSETDVSNCRHLVVSGGEPVLQRRALQALRDELDWYIEVETSGSVDPGPTPWADLYTVSIKLENSGNSLKKRLNENAIRSFVNFGNSVFKFVVSNEVDFQEIDYLVSRFNLRPVYVMPEGVSAQVVSDGIKMIAPAAIQRGYRISTRLQVLTYGKQRKV